MLNNGNGDALWGKVLIDNGNETLWDFSLDPDNNVYLAGMFQYNMIVEGNYILGSTTSDPFIMKFDSNGNFIRVNLGTGLSNNVIYTIDAALDGSIYVSGTFDGTLEFDSLSLTSDGYYDDIFILKLDSAGNEKWLKTIHGNGVLEPYDIISDQFGNFYTSGLFWDSAQVDNVQLSAGVPWVGQTYVASYQSNGSLNWAIQAGDTNGNRELYTRSLALANCAGLFAAGRLKQTASFDNLNVTSYGLDDAFFARISNSVSRTIAGNTIICSGDTSQLIATGGSNYLWLPDSIYGNQIFVHPDSTTHYYLTGTACDGSPFTDSIEVSILELDSVAPPIYVCNGDSAFILGAYRDSSGFYDQTFVSSYACDSTFTQQLVVSTFSTTTLNNDTICANEFAIIFGDTVNSSGTYSDTLSSVLGCDSITYKTLVISPIYTSNLPNDTICDGNYAIIFGDTHFVPGTYIDTLFTMNGCDSILSKTLIVETLDTSITITGTQLSANQSGAMYQWFDCNTGFAISGETSQIFQPMVSGSYGAYIDYQNCADTSSCYNVTIVEVEEVSQFILFYPNPTSDWLVIINSGTPQAELEIYNALGQLVLKQKELEIGTTRFSIHECVPGIYLGVIKSHGETIQKTIILKSE